MNTIKFLETVPIASGAKFCSSMKSVRASLFAKGVCWTDDAQGTFIENTPFRVILFPRSTGGDFKNPINGECNGLVLEYNKGWKVLAMPQKAFSTNKISMKKLDAIHRGGMYDIYEVLDATITTLYYYKGKWCMASTKAYDISDMRMVGELTFMGALLDLMATKYKAFKLEDLNKEFSYTFALRHSKYHIFDETKHLAGRTRHVPRPGVDMNSYIMVLCVADVKSITHVTKHVPGLPTQNSSIFKDNNVFALTKYARSAYAKFSKAHRLQSFKYKPLYGYILRANHKSVSEEYSTIYIESELYRVIKAGLYKDNQALRDMDYDRLVTQMSMNHDRYDQFRIIFKQLDEKFEKLESSINSLSGHVIQRIINEDEGDEGDETRSEIDRFLIESLVDEFKNEHDINPGVIKDALYSKSHSELLFQLMK